MAQKILITHQELNTLLVGFLSNIPSFYTDSMYQMYSTLYSHGFRIRELELLPEWEFLPPKEVLAKTLKGSADRILSEASLLPLVLSSIGSPVNYLYQFSYSTYQRTFDKYSGVLGFALDDGPISTHLFRHNYIKKLDSLGETIAAIKVKTGILSDDVVQGYIDSNIYKIV